MQARYTMLISNRSICQSGFKYYTKRNQRYFIKLNLIRYPQLERQGADIQRKVEELEEINRSLRNRDKLKDDAISQLSDQLVALSTTLQEIERRQQLLS
jgi:hypothetical protein